MYNWLFPRSCVLCDNATLNSRDLCPDCLTSLPSNLHCCSVCALPLQHTDTQNRPGLGRPELDKEQKLKCGNCTTANGPITSSLIPYLYRPPVDFMIRRLKYAGDTKYSRLIGTLISQAATTRLTAWPDCLIPVPLHNSRYRERGFNQAHLIAKHISSHLDIPVDRAAVSRIIASDKQAALSARARLRNMHRAFSVNSSVEGKSIAIVDDVYTTGATCTTMAKSLISAGARRVDVWAFARTP